MEWMTATMALFCGTEAEALDILNTQPIEPAVVLITNHGVEHELWLGLDGTWVLSYIAGDNVCLVLAGDTYYMVPSGEEH